MKYRVTCDLAFENEAEAQEVYKGLRKVFMKAKRLNLQEGRRIEIHRCYHDETPFKPCETIEEVVDAVEVP